MPDLSHMEENIKQELSNCRLDAVVYGSAFLHINSAGKAQRMSPELWGSFNLPAGLGKTNVTRTWQGLLPADIKEAKEKAKRDGGFSMDKFAAELENVLKARNEIK